MASGGETPPGHSPRTRGVRLDKQTRSLQHLAHRYLSRLLEAYPALFETISELDRGERLRLGFRSEHCKKEKPTRQLVGLLVICHHQIPYNYNSLLLVFQLL